MARSILGRMDPATAATLSRVILEPVMMRDAAIGDDVSAAVIRAELASRPWQGFNPYADGASSGSPGDDDAPSVSTLRRSSGAVDRPAS